MRPQVRATEQVIDIKTPEEIDGNSALSIADIVQMLDRHKWFIIACVLVSMAASAAYIKMFTPIYEAKASIRIDPARAGSLGLADLAGAASQDEISTELAIIKSDAVAIETLNSLSESDFKAYAGVAKSQLHFPEDATSLSGAQESLLGRLKSQIGAAQIPDTQLVAITCTDTNPKMAAMLVNHVISAYLHHNVSSRYGAVTQVSEYLSSQMDTLRQRAADAQRKLADFQEKNNILSSDSSMGPTGGASTNTTMERLSQLNGRLTEAQSNRIMKEAQMRAAQASDFAVLSALFPSAHLTELEANQNKAATLYEELSTKFGAKYPPLIQAKEQKQKADTELAAEMITIKNRLKEEYDAAVAVESSLQQQYDDQTQKAYALNREQAEYAVLKSEGASSNQIYNTLQYKLQQAGVDAGLGGINTTLVDTARAPLVPIAPKKTMILSIGLALGLFVGVGTVLLKEATLDKVHSVEQVERTLGYHLLTTVPHFESTPSGQLATLSASEQALQFLVTHSRPLSREAESFRTLRNSILLSSMNAPAKTVLVTSTIPGEGKSTTSANFAVVMAQNGSRVLIIDADLRRPTLHARYGVPNNKGLSNLILGEDIAPPFVRPVSELDNLFFLPAGKKVPLPAEALSSTKFYSLLKEWEQQFDYVIIDSAPLLIVSDSLPLASWVDTLILVSRFDMTPINALKRIRSVLARTNANVAGVIINDFSNKAAAYGGYGYGYGNGYYN
jgi:capsular exopolysaccharide synthesis family protein